MSRIVGKVFEAWLTHGRQVTERLSQESTRLIAESTELAAKSRELRCMAERLRSEPNDHRWLVFGGEQWSNAPAVEQTEAGTPPPELRCEVSPAASDGTDVVWLPRPDRELEPLACCPKCRESLTAFPRDRCELMVCRSCGFVSRSLTPSAFATAKRSVAHLWVTRRRETRRDARRQHSAH